MPEAPTRVALIDDHALFRDGVKQILQFEEDFRIVGEAADGDSGVEVVRRVRPDVVLLDVEMPGSHVTETAARIRQVSPETKIIILSMHDEPALVNRLVGLGVCGYLLKSVTRLELLTAVRGAARHPDQVILSVSRESLMSKDNPVPDTLSGREREVIELTAQAMSNSQIAARLNISEATVKRHLYNVFGKLGAVSRIDAVNKYYNRQSG
ncbi:response regulator transcription factor [Kutzneria buriramensis]|jgi:DNA-binding NarL/FixJ family response regulator|uniref:DNA-binding NarL/FixJ family response regulator n=1 Tax=Kutzneria buriramensis TaxID=1045776 RepID=A0A3E0H4A5_9PSEU|nr:response regulator transcription factor [Kutzneria buriramensis]REH38079.1 DNA-binding NarL/FixJ family response regulator [Kutzneria buriramensis]